MTTVKKRKRCSFVTFINEQVSKLEEEKRLGTAKNYLCARNNFISFIHDSSNILLSAIDEKINNGL